MILRQSESSAQSFEVIQISFVNVSFLHTKTESIPV